MEKEQKIVRYFSEPRALRMGIPKRMHGGLERWVEQGIPPGSFLRSLLENNLKESVLYADEENRALIPAYVQFLRETFPPGAWGSEKNCRKWEQMHRRRLQNEIDRRKKRAETEAPNPSKP